MWSFCCRCFTCTICVPSPWSIGLRHRWVYWVELAYKSNNIQITCSVTTVTRRLFYLGICKQKSNVLAVIFKAEIKSWWKRHDKIYSTAFHEICFVILDVVATWRNSWTRDLKRHLELQNKLCLNLDYDLIYIWLNRNMDIIFINWMFHTAVITSVFRVVHKVTKRYYQLHHACLSIRQYGTTQLPEYGFL